MSEETNVVSQEVFAERLQRLLQNYTNFSNLPANLPEVVIVTLYNLYTSRSDSNESPEDFMAQFFNFMPEQFHGFNVHVNYTENRNDVNKPSLLNRVNDLVNDLHVLVENDMRAHLFPNDDEPCCNCCNVL